jgi:hypothetical protein
MQTSLNNYPSTPRSLGGLGTNLESGGGGRGGRPPGHPPGAQEKLAQNTRFPLLSVTKDVGDPSPEHETQGGPCMYIHKEGSVDRNSATETQTLK